MTFTPLCDFYCEEFKSEYCRGLSYTVRNARLFELAKQWERDGKIKFTNGARVAGEIKVS
jgi:hypothetical protein